MNYELLQGEENVGGALFNYQDIPDFGCVLLIVVPLHYAPTFVKLENCLTGEPGQHLNKTRQTYLQECLVTLTTEFPFELHLYIIAELYLSFNFELTNNTSHISIVDTIKR